MFKTGYTESHLVQAKKMNSLNGQYSSNNRIYIFLCIKCYSVGIGRVTKTVHHVEQFDMKVKEYRIVAPTQTMSDVTSYNHSNAQWIK